MFEIATRVHEYVERSQLTLPDGIALTVWQDRAGVLRAQLTLLLRNGLTGFVLVFILLALFLELRLAFFVSLGIPISFLGAIMLMPGLDLSLNIITFFGFIVVLGIVVDDAIIVGENIFTHQAGLGDTLRGSIAGAQEIATPLVFAVLTTVAAFLPLMFVPGMMGKMFRGIPLIVIACLLFSLVESLNILPAHVSHRPTRRHRGPWTRFQARFANGLTLFIRRVYAPSLELGLRWRYLTAAVGVSTLIVTVGMVLGGRTSFHFFPSMEADVMTVAVTMPQGNPASATSEALRKAEVGAARLRSALRDETGKDYFRHVFASVGDQPTQARGAQMTGQGAAAPYLGEVAIELIPAQERVFTSEQLGNRWRELTGPIPETVEVNFQVSEMSPGADVDVMLVGRDIDELRSVADDVTAQLRNYTGVYDITDTFREGKEELKLGILPAAETLGLSLADLGRQVRQAFYGEEAQRIQRGRDDIRVMVRYPLDDRRSLGALENMRVRTSDGGAVPFGQVATVDSGRGFSSIKRVDGNRAVNVRGSVDENVTSSGAVVGDLV